MKKVICSLFLALATLFIVSPIPVAFAEEDEGRNSQKYDESAYELMSYSDESWYQFGEKTTNSLASSIKNMMWMSYLVLSQAVLMIVYQMFSLDIVELTMEAVKGISASVAGGLVTSFGTFALAIFSIGVVIRAYIQQNWQAFIKLVSLVVISLSLLFSISSERFDYIGLAHGLSIHFENMIMNINPSLNENKGFDPFNTSDTSVALENKVFEAQIYKPYLFLQYGTTDEAAIVAEDSERITAYLEADPRTEEGIKKRGEIAEDEYKKYENYNVFAGGGFKQAGYIMVMFLSTLIQGILYFFIALLRIGLQFGFIVLLMLAPFAIFLSIFPSFETLVSKYLKVTWLLLVFKALVMFFILVSISFVSLGYDMTDANDNLYYRIFVQMIMSLAIIFMYNKRQAVMNMLEGSGLSVDDMGGGAIPGARGAKRFLGGHTKKNASALAEKTLNKGKKMGSVMKNRLKQSGTSLKHAGSNMAGNMAGKSKDVTSMASSKVKNINEGVKAASGRFAAQQRGEDVSGKGNIYEGDSGERAAAAEVAATREGDSTSGFKRAKNYIAANQLGESSGRNIYEGNSGERAAAKEKSTKAKIASSDSTNKDETVRSPARSARSTNSNPKSTKRSKSDQSSTNTSSSKTSTSKHRQKSQKYVPPKSGKNLTKWEAEQQAAAQRENTPKIDVQKIQKINENRINQLRKTNQPKETRKE